MHRADVNLDLPGNVDPAADGKLLLGGAAVWCRRIAVLPSARRRGITSATWPGNGGFRRWILSSHSFRYPMFWSDDCCYAAVGRRPMLCHDVACQEFRFLLQGILPPVCIRLAKIISPQSRSSRTSCERLWKSNVPLCNPLSSDGSPRSRNDPLMRAPNGTPTAQNSTNLIVIHRLERF